ncbi:MAG: T9SS type A sorting domain-containing protein [Ignavibacteriae bacterium]|nr:T9SS type A sorting domain-containing protein [Ignavibacteriota bacterium]
MKQVDLDGTIHFTEPINVSSPTSVKEVAPREFALKQNYPNPFNPETNIKFSVEETGRATLEIFNLLGQKVATLFDNVVEAGYYQTVKVDGAHLASGMYLYRLQTGNYVGVKKLVLTK